MLADRSVFVNDVPDTAPIFVNGPDDDVELNTPYHPAPVEAVHDIVIWLDEMALAVTPIGVVSGGESVLAEDIADGELVPTLLIDDT